MAGPSRSESVAAAVAEESTRSQRGVNEFRADWLSRTRPDARDTFHFHVTAKRRILPVHPFIGQQTVSDQQNTKTPSSQRWSRYCYMSGMEQ